MWIKGSTFYWDKKAFIKSKRHEGFVVKTLQILPFTRFREIMQLQNFSGFFFFFWYQIKASEFQYSPLMKTLQPWIEVCLQFWNSNLFWQDFWFLTKGISLIFFLLITTQTLLELKYITIMTSWSFNIFTWIFYDWCLVCWNMDWKHLHSNTCWAFIYTLLQCWWYKKNSRII